MDGPGSEFFSGAALSGDDGGSIAGAEALDQVVHFVHGLAGADKITESGPAFQLRRELSRRLSHFDVGFRRFEDGPQLWIIHGFGNEILRALLHRLDGQIDACVRRHQDHRPVRIACLQASQEIQPGQLWHDDV